MHQLKWILLGGCLIFGSARPEREGEHSYWKPNVSRNLFDYMKMEDTAILKPQSFKAPCDLDGLMWIFIASAPTNREARDAIRQTWGNTAFFNHSMFDAMHPHAEGKYLPVQRNNSRIRVTFIIGITEDVNMQWNILEEHRLYGDILQDNFVDSYHNLTIKSMHIMKWASLNKCVRQYPFIVKADDDIYLNTINLAQVLMGGTIPQYGDLRTLNTSPNHLKGRLTDFQLENLIMGEVLDEVIPHKYPSSKYYVPSYVMQDKIFPRYAFGYAYVMSTSVVHRLLEASHISPLVNLEDVYCTGILSRQAGIKPINNHLWSLRKLSSLCQRRGIIAENLDGAQHLGLFIENIFQPSHVCNIAELDPNRKR